MQDFKPTLLCGTPSYILHLAEVADEMGVDFKDLHFKSGIFGAEPWTEEMRQELEAKLHLKAIDIYGLSEVMGPGVSIECYEEQNGLHVFEDHFIVEVIDPDTLEPLPHGEPGRTGIYLHYQRGISRDPLPDQGHHLTEPYSLFLRQNPYPDEQTIRPDR